MQLMLGAILVLLGIGLGITAMLRLPLRTESNRMAPSSGSAEHEQLMQRVDDLLDRVNHLAGIVRTLADRPSQPAAATGNRHRVERSVTSLPPARRTPDPGSLIDNSNDGYATSSVQRQPVAEVAWNAPPEEAVSSPYRLGPGVSPGRQPRSAEVLRARYNASIDSPGKLVGLLADFGGEAVEIHDEHVLPATIGKLWLMRDLDDGWATLLPAGEVVRDWKKFYTAMDAMQARQLLSACYTLTAADELEILSLPQVVLDADGRLQELIRGALQGI